MTDLRASWRQLTSSSILQRSSQTVSVVGDKAYIFSGELKPREPRDNDLHMINVIDASSKATATTLPSTSDSPTARVGSASTTLQGKIYVFSGRGGVDLSGLEEKGSIWSFDPRTSRWSIVSPAEPATPYPEARSYHTLASDGEETLYLHAGCSRDGRLSDLWSFHLPSKRWTQLSAAPEPARGGTSIAFSGGQLYRIHGFDGKTEQGGNIDIYDIKAKRWTSFPFSPDGNSGPEPRSVSSLLAIKIGHRPSLVAMFGERDPSSLGHEGAGKMLDDIWVFDIQSKNWSRALPALGETPVARGWFDADVVRDSTEEAIVVQGGLNVSNERLGDLWLLKLDPTS